MPQLVKGGKYIFGWTILNKDLSIRIPDETFYEYKFVNTDNIILMSGSKTSGGFSIITPISLIHSRLNQNILESMQYKIDSNSFASNKLDIIKFRHRLFCWTSIDEKKYFKISNGLIDLLDLKIGSKLLVGRGSGLGPAFIAKGTIYNEALNHKDILEFC